jgi:uncharacterized protein with ParB-like and HNH nuclease domain
MQASETKLRQLIEGTKQYVVPLFQRPYSWSEKQWKTLWADMVEKAKHGDGRAHFFGSVVTTPAKSVPQGVGKYLLIDGQQRITTTQVLLAAIRDLADVANDHRLRDRIEGQYLTNAYEDGDERLKVLPTQDDRDAFRAIISRNAIPASLLGRCYAYFRSRLEQWEPERLDALHLAVVDRFSLVSITCDEHDNPHLIFESLNAKGEKLTPADLIRNFLLMQVHVGKQDALFRAYWLPIQQALNSDLTEFVRHYLMMGGKILREAEVYFELKDRLAGRTSAEAEEFLRDLHRHGLLYARFVDPSQESDTEIAERLDRVRRLKVTVAYPFLLRVFDAFQPGGLNRSQVLETLELLESFVVRRAICGAPTNQLRRMFPPVFDATGGPGPTFVDGVRRQLGGPRCPDDAAFAQAMATQPLYATADKNVRLRLILERIERSFGHKELGNLATASIEHVMPQTLTAEWRQELGDDATASWERLLHTLGNLTLTAYNAELSNKPYSQKRQEFMGSHFDLNRHFDQVERWTPDRIRERGAALAEAATRIWPDVGRIPGTTDREKRPSQPPVAVRYRESRQSCKNWRDGFTRLLKLFEASKPGTLSRIADEQALIAVVSRDPSRFQRSRLQVGDVYVNTHASAAQLQDWSRKIADLAGISPSDYEFIMPGEVSAT